MIENAYFSAFLGNYEQPVWADKWIDKGTVGQPTEVMMIV